MMEDLDKDTVDYVPNFDETTTEPTVLPGDLSRTCWSTARPASPSAWPPTSRRTTCGEVIDGVVWIIENTLMAPTDEPDAHARAEAARN